MSYEADLLDSYDAAMVVFNAASATLIDQLAAESLPTDEQMVREQNARAAAVTARRQLLSVYDPPTTGRPILRRS
jgi:hypothetical protein